MRRLWLCSSWLLAVTGRSLTAEDREAVWDEISDEVSALLQGHRELASSAMPFDAASTITIEQQRSDQLITYGVLRLLTLGLLYCLWFFFSQL